MSDHRKSIKDIEETQQDAIDYLLISEADLTVAKLYCMIHPNTSGGPRSAAGNPTAR